jgi:isochorismate pyruvate lyase
VSKRKICADMTEVRAEIDTLDRQIVALLADRLHYIEEAARIKKSRDQVRDEARIADVLRKVGAEARKLEVQTIHGDPTVILKTYRALIEASIKYELRIFDALDT